MASFNKVILIGNHTADPELRQTASGLSVCSFSIAVNRRFAKDGEQSCDFITCVAWKQTAEFITRYFKKGEPILVCGQLQTRTWTDNQGQKRYATEVICDEVTFVSPAGNAGAPAQAGYAPDAYGTPTFNKAQGASFEEIPYDSDLPF